MKAYIIQRRTDKRYDYGFNYKGRAKFEFIELNQGKVPRLFSEQDIITMIREGILLKIYKVIEVEVRGVRHDK